MSKLFIPYERRTADFDATSVDEDALAYILGTLLGDASLSNDWLTSRHYNIRLQTKDKDFAEEFGKNLSKLLKRKVPIRYFERQTKRGLFKGYDVEVGDKPLFLWLKALNISMMLCFGVKPSFMRGFFDSECTVNKYTPYIRAYNKNISLLKNLAHILEAHYGLHAILHTNYENTCPSLTINGRLQLVRFLEKIGLSISRKRNILIYWRDYYETNDRTG